jgi:hypothetical protein
MQQDNNYAKAAVVEYLSKGKYIIGADDYRDGVRVDLSGERTKIFRLRWASSYQSLHEIV